MMDGAKRPTAREVYRNYIGMVHMGAGYKSVTTLAKALARTVVDCNRSASIAAQELGYLPRGMIVKHTAKRDGKRSIKEAVKLPAGVEQHYRFYWVDKLVTEISKEKLVEGALLIYNSNAALCGGDGYIYSCNKSVGGRYKTEGDYRIRLGDKSRYVGKSKVLVIGVPKA